MYNSKHIAAYIDAVNAEAQKAAQAVYDKAQDKLEQMILNQLPVGSEMIIGMGTCYIVNAEGNDVGEKLKKVLSETQYTQINTGFNLPDIRKYRKNNTELTIKDIIKSSNRDAD